MDATIASIVNSVIALVIISYTIKLANRYWFRPKKMEKRLRELGFRGNPYRIIFGDAKDVDEMRAQVTSKPMELSDDITYRVLPYYHHMRHKYGKSYFIWFGTKPRLSIMDPALVKEILSRPNEFRKPGNDQMGKVLAGGLFITEGDTWAKHKKILNPSFHIEKIKNMVPSIVERCLEMTGKWNRSLASKESIEVDMVPEIDVLLYNIMCRTVLGSHTNSEETKRMYQLRITLNQQAAKLAKLMFFPWWWNIPTQEVKTMKAAHKETQSLFKKVVCRRLEEMKNGTSNGGDMLSQLLEGFQSEANGLSLDDVIEECRSFTFIGTESTARSMIWVLYVLANYPEWQERAREEVFKVFGDQKPSVEGLNQLNVVTMIAYEALRLYPPTGIFHRSISRDTKLGDMVLPAWMQITIPITLMNHDPDIWGEDAKQFKPERFAEGVLNSKIQSIFLAFSGGPRKCIGQSMAIVAEKLVISTLLQSFSLELSPSYLHAPRHSFFLVPQHGMKLVLRKIR